MNYYAITKPLGVIKMSHRSDLSTFEAAEELGVSIRTVQQWMEKGVLSGWKTPGGHRRVNAEEVRRLAEKRSQENKLFSKRLCNILVIEDDPDICKLYELMSRTWDVPVSLHFEHDGLKGLIAVGKMKPDFVIVDLNIPSVDGFQLIETLSSQFQAKTFRCCVVTGLSTEEIAKRGKLPENCPIFGKPIDFVALEKLIRLTYREVTEALIQET
jgi:excisionase family DNA binding protein